MQTETIQEINTCITVLHIPGTPLIAFLSFRQTKEISCSLDGELSFHVFFVVSILPGRVSHARAN